MLALGLPVLAQAAGMSAVIMYSVEVRGASGTTVVYSFPCEAVHTGSSTRVNVGSILGQHQAGGDGGETRRAYTQLFLPS